MKKLIIGFILMVFLVVPSYADHEQMPVCWAGDFYYYVGYVAEPVPGKYMQCQSDGRWKIVESI